MPASADAALPQFALAYCLLGVILATGLGLLLCVGKAVPAANGRRIKALGIALTVEIVATALLVATGMLLLNPGSAREKIEKPLKDENAKLQQQYQQAATAAQQAHSQLQPLQQRAQADEQGLVKDEDERQRLLQQRQNLGQEITNTVVSSDQTQVQQLQQNLREAQAQIAQLKEVNASLNDELAIHAVHRTPQPVVSTPAPGMTPILR